MHVAATHSVYSFLGIVVTATFLYVVNREIAGMIHLATSGRYSNVIYVLQQR